MHGLGGTLFPMTYYGSKELAAAFRTVRNNTLKIAEEIPEDQYGFRPTPESRSVAQTLVHIGVAVRVAQQIHFVERRNTLVGFDFFGLLGVIIAEEQKPRTKAEIVELLKTEGEKYADAARGMHGGVPGADRAVPGRHGSAHQVAL